MDNGYEVQIDATDTADRTTGSIYAFQAADIAARDAALNPPGEWNTYELLVEGERLQVFLNGAKINDFTNTNPVRSSPGTSASRTTAPVTTSSFRNIRIKELGGTTPTGTGPIKGLAGKCLDVRGGGTANGTQIQLYTCNGVPPDLDGHRRSTLQGARQVPGRLRRRHRQRHARSSSGPATAAAPELDGRSPTARCATPQSGKCLDVSGNNSADSTVVLLWTCNSSAANQKWTLPQ